MEECLLTKFIIYFVAAVVFGLLLTLIPFFTIAEIRVESDYRAAVSAPSITEKIEGSKYGYDVLPYFSGVLEVLAISFAVALFAYLLAKRRIL